MNNIAIKCPKFDIETQDFCYEDDLADYLLQPLSLTVQITRNCNIKCNWCSESQVFDNPTTEELKYLADQIKGVQRVYLSGGEPLLREDFCEIVDYYSERFNVVALLTNGTLIDEEMAEFLKGKIKYVKIGLDGPSKIHNVSRAKYEDVLLGIKNLVNVGIDVSISAMLLNSNMPYLDLLVQTADILNISHIKLIEPVRRGRGQNCSNDDIPTHDDIMRKIIELNKISGQVGWKTKIEYTFWDDNTKGYSILVYPNLDVHVWPILEAENASSKVGNLFEESITGIWSKIPFHYKKSHILKYTGKSMKGV